MTLVHQQCHDGSKSIVDGNVCCWFYRSERLMLSRVRFIQPAVIIRTVSSKKYVYRCTYSMMLYLYVHRGTHSHGRSRPFSRRIKGINSYTMSRSKSGIEMNSLSEYLFVMKELALGSFPSWPHARRPSLLMTSLFSRGVYFYIACDIALAAADSHSYYPCHRMTIHTSAPSEPGHLR
jgi:hypothetical protein